MVGPCGVTKLQPAQYENASYSTVVKDFVDGMIRKVSSNFFKKKNVILYFEIAVEIN